MANIISICGLKNSGKTTLITGLIDYFRRMGLRIAVIKHDGHDFACDIPGTDTYRFTEHGAYGAACYSDSRIFVHKTGTGETAADLVGLFPEADIILIEGMKDSALSKIEVVRQEISSAPVSNPDGLFLIATDWPEVNYEVPSADLNNIESIAKAILDRIAL